jgi:hypothetical protein
MGAASNGISPTEHYIYDVSRLGDQASMKGVASAVRKAKKEAMRILLANALLGIFLK